MNHQRLSQPTVRCDREASVAAQDRRKNQTLFPCFLCCLLFKLSLRPLPAQSRVSPGNQGPSQNQTLFPCFLCCLLFKLSLRPLPAQSRVSPGNQGLSQKPNSLSPFVSFAAFCSKSFEAVARPIASFSREPRTVPKTKPPFPFCFLCCLLFKLSLRPLPAQSRVSPGNQGPSQKPNPLSPFVSFATFCSNCL